MSWRARIGWSLLPAAVVVVACGCWLAVTLLRIGSNPPGFNPLDDMQRLLDVSGSRDHAYRQAGRFLTTYGLAAVAIGGAWLLVLMLRDFARARWRELLDAVGKRAE